MEAYIIDEELVSRIAQLLEDYAAEQPDGKLKSHSVMSALTYVHACVERGTLEPQELH